MYPFLVFDLGLDATDKEVADRYHELLKIHPPDRDPAAFAEIRAAYEALKDKRSRLKTWLFSFDRFGRNLTERRGRGLAGETKRPRAKAEELASVLRTSPIEDDHE